MRADAGGFVPDSAAPAMHFLLIMSPAHHCLQQSNAYLQIMVSIVFIERLFILIDCVLLGYHENRTNCSWFTRDHKTELRGGA